MRIINCERLCLSLSRSCLDYVDIILLFFVQDGGVGAAVGGEKVIPHVGFYRMCLMDI